MYNYREVFVFIVLYMQARRNFQIGGQMLHVRTTAKCLLWAAVLCEKPNQIEKKIKCI